MTDPTRFLPGLLRREGAVSWLYRDVLGYATIGVGNLVHDADEACGLPLYNVSADRPATEAEIRTEFQRVMSCQRGLRAAAYRTLKGPHIELSAAEIERLALHRLTTEFLPGVARILPAFETLPAPAQEAIVDMAWNLGVVGLERFGHLLRAIDLGDWAEAARQCHRATCREERNAWTAAQFTAAAERN